MEIKKPRMGFRMIKKCSKPCHSIVIVVIGLWGLRNGKFLFLKWIFPLLSTKNLSNDAFRKKNMSRVNFVISMGDVNRMSIHQD